MSDCSAAKVVLVTGCSKGGIGFCLCEEFAEKGCIVYATARKLASMEEFTNERIRKLTLDVTSDDDVQRAIDKIVAAEGHIDIVVNNAGVICVGPVIDIPVEQVKNTFDANVFGALRTARAAIPHMAKRGSGVIVNVGSIVGDIPTPWNGIYCASKAALHSITEVLQMECKPLNISVVLLAPGSVKSNLANNHSKLFSLPENTLYGDYLNQIIRRMHISQGSGSMPTDEFARKTVGKILSKKPPRYLRLGGNTSLFAILTWLPRGLVLWLVWRSFSGKA